jgi:hypothetical protein
MTPEILLNHEHGVARLAPLRPLQLGSKLDRWRGTRVR